MQAATGKKHAHRAGEAGYTLVAVMFILFVMTIWLSVAMPRMIKALQRDQELETQQRGKQYIRAIQLYYRQFHSFPPTLDVLVKSNNLRFLRKKYKDPTTGKEEWKIIRYGQAKTQTLGFFGQPLMGGGAFGGIGPVGVQNNSPLGGSSTDSSQSSLSGTTPAGTGTDPSTSSQSSMQPGSTQNPFAGSGLNGSPTGAPGQTGLGGQPGQGLTGQTFGGGGIIGFSPNSPKPTMITYRKRNKYNEWEFIYDPALEQYYASGAAAAGGAGMNPGQQGFGMNPTGVGGNYGNPGTTGNSWGVSSPGAASPGGMTGPGAGTGQNGGSIFQ